mmetsp:Transcript_3509/g.7303  ORF Transcript_3509/g.7303 Transcript_3509/m.7303 type:complete len:942 (-) Transcript_3509:166-2991(-)|eukprot:CAMPEP_0118954996 /NCGR_PEP_ID=MMETSP1169-20130426/59294_1 /TAXON_ID=36882 /ORGANISM="Pyramimonas obovata, Strain CCMP722" /LENGTH=941 /DNA_ID=CAMNT_0006902755 /DNA_START=224 /DNA_END=3049 /DNA_ORIENTATION=+
MEVSTEPTQPPSAQVDPWLRGKSGNVISHRGLPEDLQEVLKEFDVTGDGNISLDELAHAASLYRGSKKSQSNLRKVVVSLIFGIILLIAANFGLMFVVVDLTKDTEVDSSGNLLAKGGAHETVRTANSDYYVGEGAHLYVRAAPSEDGVPSNSSTSSTGTTPLVTVAAEAVSYERPLQSCLPNSYFSEMKAFVITRGLAHMELAVLGYVRMPRAHSLYGTVVMIITHIGRVVVDGEAVSFIDDIGHIFAEAGFEVEASSRRLLGLLELSAMFNAIPAEAYACFEYQTDGPAPRFPGSYMTTVKTLSTCQEDGTDHCAHLSDHERSTLETLDGREYAVGYATVHVSLDLGVSREEWHLPARTSNYTYVEIKRKSDYNMSEAGINDPVDEEKFTFMMSPSSALNPTGGETPSLYPQVDLSSGDRVGYYCHDIAHVHDPDAYSGADLSDTKNFNAAYHGVTSIPDHEQARHWVIQVKNQSDHVWYLYDAITPAGDYHPVRLELYRIGENMLLQAWIFGEMITEVDMSQLASLPGFDKPSTCHQYGRALPRFSASSDSDIGPGGGVIPVEQWLFSNNPLPHADDAILDSFTSVPELLDPASMGASSGVANQTTRKLQGWDTTTMYSCCANGDAQVWQTEEQLFGLDIPATGVLSASVSIDMTRGFAGGEQCYWEVEASGSVCGGLNGIFDLCFNKGGSGYLDVAPASLGGFGNCFEAGGCIYASLTIEALSVFSFTLGQLNFCLLGGRGNDGGPDSSVCTYRPYISGKVGMEFGSNWIGVVGVDLYGKFWMQDPQCTAKTHFDPYAQVYVRFPCFFGHCHSALNYAFHFLGQPGEMVDDASLMIVEVGECVFDFATGCLTSHSGNGQYSNRQDCTVRAKKAVTLSVHEFDVESHTTCAWDYVEVGGDRYCGTSGPDGHRLGAGQTLKFHTDASETRDGFKICVSQ